MGESLQHINLVYRISEVTNAIVPIEFSNFVTIDVPGSNEKPPQMLEGFRPDLYYCHDGLMIIGEAKTAADFERKHSKEQYLSYLRTCFCFEGSALMILAVPWTEYITAKNLLKRIKKKYNYDIQIKVVNDLGRVEII